MPPTPPQSSTCTASNLFHPQHTYVITNLLFILLVCSGCGSGIGAHWGRTRRIWAHPLARLPVATLLRHFSASMQKSRSAKETLPHSLDVRQEEDEEGRSQVAHSNPNWNAHATSLCGGKGGWGCGTGYAVSLYGKVWQHSFPGHSLVHSWSRVPCKKAGWTVNKYVIPSKWLGIQTLPPPPPHTGTLRWVGKIFSRTSAPLDKCYLNVQKIYIQSAIICRKHDNWVSASVISNDNCQKMLDIPIINHISICNKKYPIQNKDLLVFWCLN